MGAGEIFTSGLLTAGGIVVLIYLSPE